MPELSIFILVLVGVGFMTLLVISLIARGAWGVARSHRAIGEAIVERATTPTWVKDLLPVIDAGERLKLVGASLEGIPALRCNACGHVDPRLTEFCQQCGERLIEEHRAADEAQSILG